MEVFYKQWAWPSAPPDKADHKLYYQRVYTVSNPKQGTYPKSLSKFEITQNQSHKKNLTEINITLQQRTAIRIKYVRITKVWGNDFIRTKYAITCVGNGAVRLY